MSVEAMTRATVTLTQQFAQRTQVVYDSTTEAIQKRSQNMAQFLASKAPAEEIALQGLQLRGARVDIQI